MSGTTFIEKVDNRLHGIYLLSVEAENIVKNIDRVINPPQKDKKSKSGRAALEVFCNPQ
jgi:hypothetical protein